MPLLPLMCGLKPIPMFLVVRIFEAEIRSTFRDGRDVEASAAEIEAHSGTGDYDLVLRAPFPAIEILRRRVRNRQGI